ncbi:MAG: hypothetical protein M5T61_13345 [Acidimicrobiia bacterium]|nr:hypothetical protein [Acidimicrobiia bacterium]
MRVDPSAKTMRSRCSNTSARGQAVGTDRGVVAEITMLSSDPRQDLWSRTFDLVLAEQLWLGEFEDDAARSDRLVHVGREGSVKARRVAMRLLELVEVLGNLDRATLSSLPEMA